jgi:hypothetical protein
VFIYPQNYSNLGERRLVKKIISRTALALAIFSMTVIAFSIQSAIACELVGDLNGDGTVNIEDLFIAAEAYGSYPGHPRWNPQADINGDDEVDIMDLFLIAKHFGETTPTVITATVVIYPQALNLRSNGRWITARIELPEGYNLSDIDVSTIMLNNTIPVELTPIHIGDCDCDGTPDLMVKFERQKVIDLILKNYQFTGRFGMVTLTITGEMAECAFQGSDDIKIIQQTHCELLDQIFRCTSW